MSKSVVKERMRKGETVVGARCCYTDPEIMGLMAMGFNLFSAASDFSSVRNGLRNARSELEAIGIEFTNTG